MVYKLDSKYDPSCPRVWTTSSDFNNITQNDSTITLIQTRKEEQVTHNSKYALKIFAFNYSPSLFI